MNNLESVVAMRETLSAMNSQLTPYSSKVEHQRYLESLKHYKKILNSYITRATDEIDTAIMKSMSNIGKFSNIDVNIIRTQVENGSR
jgi:hypothetical protein